MKENLLKIKKEILESLAKINDLLALEKLEKQYLGRSGKFTLLLRELGNLKGEMKKEVGSLANEIKKDLEAKFLEQKNNLSGQVSAKSFLDVTLPGEKIARGHLHPQTIVQNELEELFKSLGFMVLDGPELESDYYNFEALNFLPDHPARDIQDTFYIDLKNDKGKYDLVMRTQTSPVQVRAMQKYGAPLRCVVPGRTYRCEAIDACHEHSFDQMEGLMVGKDISLSNLISVMKELINGIFGYEVETRVRPGYFPFVEPAIELDIKCTICGGRGCPGCKNSGWSEILPAGMVHPNVLRAGGIDPNIYSGFAFGLGLTRLVMMKYKISDMRLFNSGDLRFIEQF
jgi:phenylalanyl-tRNA synthetase alpha chain